MKWKKKKKKAQHKARFEPTISKLPGVFSTAVQQPRPKQFRIVAWLQQRGTEQRQRDHLLTLNSLHGEEERRRRRTEGHVQTLQAIQEIQKEKSPKSKQTSSSSPLKSFDSY